MVQVFISHSKYDKEFCGRFDSACARVGLESFRSEFEDIEKLKNLFYALEVKINELQELLFRCIDEELKILIGDEIGFDEISECSLLVSGFKERDFSLALALLGPMRMNYIKAAASLYSIKYKLEDRIKKLL